MLADGAAGINRPPGGGREAERRSALRFPLVYVQDYLVQDHLSAHAFANAFAAVTLSAASVSTLSAVTVA
jgi:hypothetical protein